MRSPELRHEVPVPIPDAFLYAEKDGRRVVILHSLEIPRVREDAPELEILPMDQFGMDELFAEGKKGWEVELEIAVRGCRELGSSTRSCRPLSRSVMPTTCARTASRSPSSATCSTTAAARRTRRRSPASAARNAHAKPR